MYKKLRKIGFLMQKISQFRAFFKALPEKIEVSLC